MTFQQYNEEVLTELEKTDFPDLTNHVINAGHLTAEVIARVISLIAKTSMQLNLPPKLCAFSLNHALQEVIAEQAKKETKH